MMSKFAILTAFSLATATANPILDPRTNTPTTVQGFDISHYQENVDFSGAYAAGARFVIIKATEGTTYKDPSFHSHTTSARNASLLTGAYHFAYPYPNTTHPHSGTDQANYFLAHGGGWTPDGQTLPGMLDLEYNPSKEGNKCYDLSPEQMVGWIQEFVDAYKAATGRAPMVYTTADWWGRCTGDSKAFSGGGEDGEEEGLPLVLARYNEVPGRVPGGWKGYSFWQNSNEYAFGGDSELWSGSEEGLRGFARGGQRIVK